MSTTGTTHIFATHAADDAAAAFGRVVTAPATLLRLHGEGRNVEALSLYRHQQPIYNGTFRAPGAASANAALQWPGPPGGPVRLPLVDLTADQHRAIRADLAATASEIGGPSARATTSGTHHHNGRPFDGECSEFLSARSVSGMTMAPRWDQ